MIGGGSERPATAGMDAAARETVVTCGNEGARQSRGHLHQARRRRAVTCS